MSGAAERNSPASELEAVTAAPRASIRGTTAGAGTGIGIIPAHKGTRRLALVARSFLPTIPIGRVLAASSLVLAITTAPAAHAQWTVTNLHPAGATASTAYGASGGQQAGYTDSGLTFHAGLWSGTAASWVDLHSAGATESVVYGANGGQQAGYAAVGLMYHASLWSGTAASWVDINPAGFTESKAFGASGGQQVGYARVNGESHASLWSRTAASWVDLNPVGATESKAEGSGGGLQVGSAFVGGVRRAGLWSGTAASWIDLHPVGATDSIAIAASGGEQVGMATINNRTRASLWHGTAVSRVDLHPAGSSNSAALDANGGQQVGWATPGVLPGGFAHASLWSGTAASWVDLSIFLPAEFRSSAASGISSDANFTYVVGDGYNTLTNRNEALLWTLPASAQCAPGWVSGIGTPGFDAGVRALAVMPNGDVIAGGFFLTAGGVPAYRIARWNGSAWSAVGSGIEGTVLALAVLSNGVGGSDLIAGGVFGTAGGVPANFIARWNGTAWSALGSGVGSVVYALVVEPNGVGGSNLIAGGAFSTAGGVATNHTARWNGTTWSALGSGMNSNVYAVAALPNGEIVAGGDFTTAGGVAASRIARWNGTAWSGLGSGMNNTQVRALAVLPSGDLIAGGDFTTAGGVAANHIASWNGTVWSTLGTGLDGSVTSLAVLPNGDLVAGGGFSHAGGVPADFIARWNGTAWSALGAGVSTAYVDAVVGLPNGDVVAGGLFTAAGNVGADHIARYTFGAPAPSISGHPQSVTICSSATATFSVIAAGAGPFTYQWQVESPESSGVYVDITSATFTEPASGLAFDAWASTTETLGVSSTTPGTHANVLRFVARVANACGGVTSNPATLTVDDCSSCIGDYNQDGGIDGSDVEAFFADWEAGNPAADVNADGGVDGADVEYFFGRWEAGC